MAHVGSPSSGFETADEMHYELSPEPAAEEIRLPDFQVDTSAEEYFNSYHGQQVRGTFQEVEVVRWDHDEADWSIEGLEFRPSANSLGKGHAESVKSDENIDTADSRNISRHFVAFERLKVFALERRWRAAAAALDKAWKQSAPLSGRERAAVEYLLQNADSSIQRRADADALRSFLFATHKREHRVEYQNPSTRVEDRTKARSPQKSLAETRPPTQKQIRSAVIRIRDAASVRGWISPKSSRALAKLGDSRANLDQSETNALTYLLGRCSDVSELAHHAYILREIGLKVK
jgi:hypothetical protein